jgi:2'-5' RNA ligase
MKIRVFLALDLPNETKEFLLEKIQLIDPDRELRWEKSNKFHLTLKFIGDVEEELLPKINDVLNNLAAEYKPFELKLDRFGKFKRNGKVAVLWAGFEENSNLSEFVEKINIALSQFGISKEVKKITPHITLLRIRKHVNKEIINKFDNLEHEPVKYVASEIELIRSTLKPSGSVYKVLEKYNLKGK